MLLDTASSPARNRPATSQIFLFFGSLTLLIYLATPSGYLVDIATSYPARHRQPGLHVPPVNRNPRLHRVCLWLGARPLEPVRPAGSRLFSLLRAYSGRLVSLDGLLPSLLLGLPPGLAFVILSFRFIAAAYQALLALIGQEKLMTGRLTTLWQVVSYIPMGASAFISGWVAVHLPPRPTFLLMAALALGIAFLGFWKPASVFRDTYEAPHSRGSGLVGDLKRLARHRAIYPAVLIMFRWNFSPGSATPLQFYLTNQLHASDAAFANFNAIFVVSFVPAFFLNGYFCKRVSLEKLLWWGTLVAVPQMIPLAFIHFGALAQILAAPIGLMGGIATAAYFDLAMLSCPAGLQGTLMMLVDGVYILSARGSDVLGDRI
jgi:hypothetical protein